MNLIKKIYSEVQADILPLEVLNTIFFDKSLNARKALFKRANQNKELVRIKNGLYIIGEEDRRYGLDLYSLANYMSRPSYISLESALSYYGLIPEAVYTTTSVTTQKSLEYKSELGVFSFTHLKQNYFNFGFYQRKNNHNLYLMATPLKAILDYIVIMKKNYKSIYELEEDLRFNLEEFFQYKEFVNKNTINKMLTKFKSHRLKVILKEMRKNL